MALNTAPEETEGSVVVENGEVASPPAMKPELVASPEVVDDEAVTTEDVVTPWNVTASDMTGVNYDKLIVKLGCRTLEPDMVARIEHITGKPAHPMLRRGLFFAHRDLGRILERAEKGKPFFLYTGRKPSSASLHLGHLIPFMFTKWLQEVFDVPLIIQMADDETFLWKNLTLEELAKVTNENIKDIIAVGFDQKKTFIFRNTEHECPDFYKNTLKISKLETYHQSQNMFRFVGEDSIGKVGFATVQAVPCFSNSFPCIFGNKKDVPCLIPCAIDQDPYFCMARDVASRLEYQKPALIYSSFLPALQGAQTKMTSSDIHTCIFMNDAPNQIKNKINKHAFSGGKATKEEHAMYGGDCSVDTSFQFLRYFEENDAKLEEIRVAYSEGKIQSGELKKIAIEVVQRVIKEMQDNRAKVTAETVKAFCTPRSLDVSLNMDAVDIRDSEVLESPVDISPAVEHILSVEAEAKNDEALANEDVVTPWNVTANDVTGVDYDKLIVKFGCRALEPDMVARIEHITGKPAHPMLRRGLFFAHRDLGRILERVEKGKPFFLYTGRGPSSGSLHLGHLIPFMFTKWLQEAFDVPLVIQMTDDEKFLWRNLTLDELVKVTNENIKDVVAVGFNLNKTFIFKNTEYRSHSAFKKNTMRISKIVTTNQTRSIFGFVGNDCTGKYTFPPIQAAPCFSNSFPCIFGSKKDIPCLIPCAIDQDPYFRMARDAAPRLKYEKPSLIFSTFLPALQGAQTKMAASDANSCIYLDDSPDQIRTKITEHAFSGDCSVDTSFQFLRYFEEDDVKLEEIRLAYSTGKMQPGELKKIAIEVVQRIIKEMQDNRAKVTDETVQAFCTPRALDFKF